MRKFFGISLVVLAVVFTTMAFLPIEDHSGYHVGDKVEDFSLMNVDKSMVSLESYGDVNGWIVVFTCNTCPYSVMYEDRLIDLHNKHAANGFPVLAINPNDPEVKEGDSFADMQVRSEEKSFPFKYLFDDGQTVYPKWGATRTPHVFILDNKKVVKYIGAVDDSPRDASSVSINYVDKAVAAISAGKSPDPAETKAIGCTIKTKKASGMQKSGKKKRKTE